MEIIVALVITGLVGAYTGYLFFKHQISDFVALAIIPGTWIGRMSIREELVRPTQEQFLLGALVFLRGYFYGRIATDYWTDIAKVMLAAEAEED